MLRPNTKKRFNQLIFWVYFSVSVILTYLLFQIYVIDSADKKRFEETGLVSSMHSGHFIMQIHTGKNHKNFLNVINLCESLFT